MKINENLNYRDYNSTVIIIPEEENCFILSGIAYKMFKCY